MNTDFEKVYHQLEKKHFWFKARRQFIIQKMKGLDRNASILDIGCSSGTLLNDLKDMGFNPNNLYGIDISEKAINNCKNNGFENTWVMDAQNIDLNKKFDIIIASDCLEHLEDDKKALLNWKGLLKPGGQAYVFVPAFMSLWSHHDEVNMHFRRYERNELKDKMIESGFQVKKSSFWNFFLFPPIYFVRSLSRMKKSDDDTQGDLTGLPMFNGILYTLLNIENKLAKIFSYPIGVSTYCIATK